MTTKLGFTLGSDPELMLYDKEQKKIVSSIPVLKRDKTRPIDLGDDIKMYTDNVLVEASFPPADTKDGFLSTIYLTMERMKDALGKRYDLLPQAAHEFPEEELQDKSAKESGCNPNYDTYARQANIPAKFTSGLRTGSFHLHIGSELLLSPPRKDEMIRLLDIFLGCSSVLFDRDSTALQRRSLYGKAGEFRPTAYGVEYRVLGNWSLRSVRITELIVDLVSHTMKELALGNAEFYIKSIPQASIVNAINQNNYALAMAVLRETGMPRELITRAQENYLILP